MSKIESHTERLIIRLLKNKQNPVARPTLCHHQSEKTTGELGRSELGPLTPQGLDTPSCLQGPHSPQSPTYMAAATPGYTDLSRLTCKGCFITKTARWMVAPKGVSPRTYEGTLPETKGHCRLSEEAEKRSSWMRVAQIQCQCPHMRQESPREKPQEDGVEREVATSPEMPRAPRIW